MPVTATCLDHPEADVLYPGDFLMHAATAHRGEPLADVGARVKIGFESRVPLPTRIFRCRYCATQVTTTDPERPPYCDEHLDGL